MYVVQGLAQCEPRASMTISGTLLQRPGLEPDLELLRLFVGVDAASHSLLIGNNLSCHRRRYNKQRWTYPTVLDDTTIIGVGASFSPVWVASGPADNRAQHSKGARHPLAPHSQHLCPASVFYLRGKVGWVTSSATLDASLWLCPAWTADTAADSVRMSQWVDFLFPQ